MKNGIFFCLFLISILFCSCAYMAPPAGAVYTDVKANQHLHSGSETALDGKKIEGKSCSYGVLGLAAWGDAGLDAALEEAGHKGEPLKNISVDHQSTNVFIFFMKYCTLVTAYTTLPNAMSPDDDNDGIANDEDKCPKKKGLRVTDGCPMKKMKKFKETSDTCAEDDEDGFCPIEE